MNLLRGVECLMRSQLIIRAFVAWYEPNACFISHSMFIAMLELARLKPGELLQELVALVLAVLFSTT